MKLTPLESAVLLAIAHASTPKPEEPVLTGSIKFEGGYSKLAGALSSLGRKGLIEHAGKRHGNGGRASESKRTVKLTQAGWSMSLLAKVQSITGQEPRAGRWTVEHERYLCFDNQPLLITKSLGEGFDGTETALAELTAKMAELLNASGVVFKPWDK